MKIDLIDGDDLTKMLQAPEDARAREELRKWGVFSVRDGYAVLEFSVFCVARHPRSHLTFSLHILLTNKGDRTAEGLKVVIEHSNTNCVAVSTDSALWDDRGKGVLNPRTVWSKADLHPGDGIRVLEMPLKADTPFPLWIKASAWLRDASPTQQSIVLQESELASNSRRVFNAAG